MSDTKVDKPTCERIVVKVERDTDMSPDQANRDAETELFTAADIENFEEDRWRYLGIYAEATVLLPLHGATFILPVPGPGLWGVESFSERSYLREVAEEQVIELKHVLDVLGVDHAEATIEFGRLS